MIKKQCVRTWQEAGHEVRVGVESTGNTRYFKNRMEEAGVKVVVINTLKFKVINESVNKTGTAAKERSDAGSTLRPSMTRRRYSNFWKKCC